MDLLSVGSGEILMILLVATLVIGPNKIVKFSRKLGQLSRNLKRMTTDFSSTITKEIDLADKLTDDAPPTKPSGAGQTDKKNGKPS
jgi:sec-independent protein translocase protein TatA